MDQFIDDPPQGFVFEELLGSGGFSKVYRARRVEDGEIFAIKVLQRSKNDPKMREQFYNEAKIMSKLSHPNIVKYFNLTQNTQSEFLIMEYIQGLTLKQMIQTFGKMKEEEAQKYFTQILDAIDYFHRETGLLHRDLKAENIMVNQKTNKIKVIDFGLAGKYTPDNPNQFCGSPKYVAPEIYNRVPYTFAADIWSLGVILFYMTAGYLPFVEETIRALAIIINNHEPKYPAKISPQLHELIAAMLSKCPNNRPTIKAIRQSVWMSSGKPLKARRLSVTVSKCGTSLSLAPKPLVKSAESAKMMIPTASSIIDKLVATGRFTACPKTPKPGVALSEPDPSMSISSSTDCDAKARVVRRRKKHDSVKFFSDDKKRRCSIPIQNSLSIHPMNSVCEST